jgi:hypothetical protein
MRSEAVVAADGDYLFDVMPSVDEVESAPLGDGEWAENLVSEDSAASEDGFCLVQEAVDTGEILMGSLDECVAVEWCGGRWKYGRRGGTTPGEDAEGDENELACAMFDGYRRLRGPALGDAGFERALREGVGEKQMIDDLLDAPFIRVSGEP